MRKKNAVWRVWLDDIYAWIKENLAECVISLALALISSAAYDYITDGFCHMTPLLLVRAFFLFGLYLSLFCLSGYFLAKRERKELSSGGKTNRQISFLPQMLTIAGIMLLFWIPYFIASYPGNMSNDTTGQLPMFFSLFDDGKEYAIQDQHPVFTTLVFGSVIYLGNLIFGNMHIALAICVILQMVVTALVFAFVVVWMKKKWKITTPLYLSIIAFLSVFPLVPLMVVSLSKDTFFCWIYALLILTLFELVRSDFKLANSNKFIIILTVLCLGACLTKKLGVYIVSGTLILFIIFCGQKLKPRLKMAIPLLVSIVSMFVVMPLIISYTSIYPSPTKEMLALPLKQTSLAYIQHKNDMSDEEKAQLDELLDLSTIEERYMPNNGDLIRGPVDNNSDFGAYIKLYIKQFFKYPRSYFDAFATQVAGLFVPYKIGLIFDNHWHTWNGGYFEESFFEKPEFSRIQSENMEKFYNWIAMVPIFNLLTFSITYVVFIPALFLTCLIKRRGGRELLLMIPVLLSAAGLMVASTVYQGNEAMRYIMPFVYTAPVLLGFSQYMLFKGVKRKADLNKVCYNRTKSVEEK